MRRGHWVGAAIGTTTVAVVAGLTLEPKGDDGVSIECAAAHVAAEVIRRDYGTTTNGIPHWFTEKYRRASMDDAYERVKEECGGFDEPRDFWLLYGNLINEYDFAAIEHENPERRPWFREVICPTFDNPEDHGLCTEEVAE